LPSTARLARTVPVVLWILAIAWIPLWIQFDHAGWDVTIYRNAIQSLQNHHDPYADAIAIQDAFHRTLAQHPNAITPFSYVYSPITLPLLKLIGALPATLAATLYWTLYILCALALVWAGLQAAEPHERQSFLCISPAVLFFPGLLHHDTILSGNVAIILYGLVFATAVVGWRKGQWHWCYLAILLASCFKAPLLTLLAIPLFSARKQLLPAALTAAAGIALFALQPLLWPSLFHNFLHAVDLLFTYNREFGSNPAGLITNLLVNYGVPYSPASTLLYLALAIPLLTVLVHLSRQFLAGRFTLEQWAPVLLVGVFLLNPRIKEYDVLPLTLPMLLIFWRTLRRLASRTFTVAFLCVAVAAINLVAVQSSTLWKIAEGILLVLVFAAGCWNLISRSHRAANITETFTAA
jgi:hypothetical protein